jgi:hypothetical protein
MINEAAVSNFAQNHGDILGVLKTPELGDELAPNSNYPLFIVASESRKRKCLMS